MALWSMMDSGNIDVHINLQAMRALSMIQEMRSFSIRSRTCENVQAACASYCVPCLLDLASSAASGNSEPVVVLIFEAYFEFRLK